MSTTTASHSNDCVYMRQQQDKDGFCSCLAYREPFILHLDICSVVQTEGESQQQQSQLEKEQLHALLEEAHQKLAKLEQDAVQTSLKAAQELETLQHNHAISQVLVRPCCVAWCVSFSFARKVCLSLRSPKRQPLSGLPAAASVQLQGGCHRNLEAAL